MKPDPQPHDTDTLFPRLATRAETIQAAEYAPKRGDLVFTPKRGDLVFTPEGMFGIVTELGHGRVSVFNGDGTWASYDRLQLVPAETGEPQPRVINFAGILLADLESFAAGFRAEPGECAGCGSLDVDLLDANAGQLCPTCVHELAEQERSEHP